MEYKFFEDGTVPEWTTAAWYAKRERAPHLEQAGHKGRLLMAAQFVKFAIRDNQFIQSVSDMGCGDGGLLSLLKSMPVTAWGYDLQPANVSAAVLERGVNAQVWDVVNHPLPANQWGDLAVCTEMLEHLIDPHGFVRDIPSKYVVASSPDGETPASHYEFHTWGWSMDAYRAMFEQGGFQVIRHETIGFQVLLGVRT